MGLSHSAGMRVEALAPAAGLLLRGAPAPSCGGAFVRTGELHKRPVYSRVEDAGVWLR